MLDQPSPAVSSSAARELAIARTLLSLLEDTAVASDVSSAADLAEQLGEQLRRVGDDARG